MAKNSQFLSNSALTKPQLSPFEYTNHLYVWVIEIIHYSRSVRLVMGDVSYVEAIYFIYVTISTIGFGDFVIRFEQHKDYDRVVRYPTFAFNGKILLSLPKRYNRHSIFLCWKYLVILKICMHHEILKMVFIYWSM